MFIGVTGESASGKDTVAEYIAQKRGVVTLSLSQYIRDAIGEGATIAEHREWADGQRKAHGSGYLAKKITEKIKEESISDAVIVSIRAIGEYEHIKKTFPGFKLIYVEAPIEKGYELAQLRKGPRDQISFEEFKRQREMQMKNKGEHHMNMKWMKGHADYVIENKGTLQDLYKEVDKALEAV